jgi:hypothetical protein
MAQPEKNAPPAPPIPPDAPSYPMPALPPVKPLQKNRLKRITSSESNFGNLHGATLPAGTPFEHALDSAMWSNVATELRANDQVQIHEDGGGYYGLVYIRAVAGGGGVKTNVAVAKLFYVQFDGLPAPSSGERVFRVAYMGPHQRWCVIRIADGKAVADQMESAEAAELQMKALERAQIKAP